MGSILTRRADYKEKVENRFKEIENKLNYLSNKLDHIQSTQNSVSVYSPRPLKLPPPIKIPNSSHSSVL